MTDDQNPHFALLYDIINTKSKKLLKMIKYNVSVSVGRMEFFRKGGMLCKWKFTSSLRNGMLERNNVHGCCEPLHLKNIIKKDWGSQPSLLQMKTEILLQWTKWDCNGSQWVNPTAFIIGFSGDEIKNFKSVIVDKTTMGRGIWSLSGSIPWIAIRTSAGVKAGPVCTEPCIIIKKNMRYLQLRENNNAGFMEYLKNTIQRSLKIFRWKSNKLWKNRQNLHAQHKNDLHISGTVTLNKWSYL